MDETGDANVIDLPVKHPVTFAGQIVGSTYQRAWGQLRWVATTDDGESTLASSRAAAEVWLRERWVMKQEGEAR